MEPLALPIRARFVPLRGRPDCPISLVHAVHPGRPVLRRSARAGRRAGLVRACGRGRLADRSASSHRGAAEAVTGCAPPAAG